MNKYPFPAVIDSSILATFKSCEKLFDNLYVQNWKPKGQSVHLHAGAAFAKGVESTRKAYYDETQSSEQAIAKGLQRLIEFYGDFDAGDSPKNLERMCGAFEFYWDRYPLGTDTRPIVLPGGKSGIEFTFAHPLPIKHPTSGDPVIFCGAMDALLAYAGGTYICDEKTTTQLGASWSRQWDLRSQFSGYAWGCEQAGIKVNGVIVRGVSILKTKYDTQEAISNRPEWQVDRWYEQMLEWIERAIFAWKREKYLLNLDHACSEFGGCVFRQTCLMSDPAPWYETYFEQRRWDPILRKEVPV